MVMYFLMLSYAVPRGTNRSGEKPDLRAARVFFRGSAGLFFGNLVILGGGFDVLEREDPEGLGELPAGVGSQHRRRSR